MDCNLYLLIQNPPYQALLFLTLTPLLLFILKPKTADKAWQIAIIPFILFMIVNAGILWLSNKPWHYFFYSLITGVGYVLLIAIIMSALLRILRLKNSEESAMAFLILIYQPLALLLIMLAKWVVT